MSALELTVALALPVAAGAALLLALGCGPRRDPLVFLGSLFPFGIGLIGVLLFFWMLVGLPVAGVGPALVAGVVTAALFALAWRRRRSTAAPIELAEPRRYDAPAALRWTGELVFALLLVVALSDVAFRALDLLHEPIVKGDSAGIWTLRAKMVFHHGAIDGGLPEVLSRSRGATHLDYPLLGTFQQVWTMSVAGELLDVAVRWPTHLWHASLVLLVFAATRRRAGALAGGVLAWLYLSLPQLPAVATGTDMDLPVAAAFLGLVDRLLRCAEERDRRAAHLTLAALWMGVLVWTKHEGAMLLLATTLGAALGLSWTALRNGVRRRELVFLLVPAVILVAQWRFNEHFGFENDLMTGGEGADTRGLFGMLFGNLSDKAGPIARFYGELALDFRRSHHLFLLFLAALLFGGRAAWSSPARFAGLTVAFAWAGYFCVYVISFQELEWHLVTSGGRTSGHLMGVLTLFLACVLGRLDLPWRARTVPSTSPSNEP